MISIIHSDGIQQEGTAMENGEAIIQATIALLKEMDNCLGKIAVREIEKRSRCWIRTCEFPIERMRNFTKVRSPRKKIALAGAMIRLIRKRRRNKVESIFITH